MSSFVEIKAAIDQTAAAFEEFKKVNDQRIEALKKGDEAKAKELDAKLAAINADLNKFGEMKTTFEREMQFDRERIEELESRAKSPGKTALEKVKDEYKESFLNWVRNRGQAPQHEQKMLELSRKAAVELKDVTIGTGSAGGFAVPEEISRMIEKLELKFSPVRGPQGVKVVRVGTSDYKELISINGATGGWVGEAGARTATLTPTLREIAPTHGELYAYPQASEWSLDDVFFNVEAWLAESVADVFAITEANAVLTGTGSNQPTGMLNSAPTAVSDEAGTRAAAVYEFVANIDAGLAILSDRLVDLSYRLNSRYRAGAVWAMNSNTTAAVRKIRETANGQYLWQPGLQAGQPDTLLGYQVTTWEQIADIANNAHPIAFGNFSRGYIVTDRAVLRITRDNVTNVGFVRFYIRRREGGIVLNNNAIKWLKTTTA